LGKKKPSDRNPRGAARLASEGEIVAGMNKETESPRVLEVKRQNKAQE
jgi:hypothetical protein